VGFVEAGLQGLLHFHRYVGGAAHAPEKESALEGGVETGDGPRDFGIVERQVFALDGCGQLIRQAEVIVRTGE